MKRDLYAKDHSEFREVVAEFVVREVVSHLSRWEDSRLIDRHVWRAAGGHGIVGLTASTEYGGAGVYPDYRYRCVVTEELSKVFSTSLSGAFALQDDMIIPYLVSLGTDAQKQRWLPAMISGEVLGAIAMSEPGTGSDLQGIRTTAKKVDGGWLINGAKTFISSGIQSHVVITVARTDADGGRDAFSLFLVEKDTPGFTTGRKLYKVGLNAQDTAELFYQDVLIPEGNLLGVEG